MKVVQYGDSFYPSIDGVITVMDNYARCFLQKGVHCIIAAPEAENAVDNYPYRVYRYKALEQDTGRFNYPIPLPGIDTVTRRKIMREKPDIVHAHTPFTMGREAYHVAKRLHVPLIGSFHSKFYDDMLAATGSPFLAEVGLRYIIDFFNKCDEVWTMNSATETTLRQYGFRGNIILVNNGIGLEYPADADAQRLHARMRLGIQPDEEVFLFVGQQDWKKGIEIILRGFAAYAEDKKARLVLVGGGRHTEEIKELAETLAVKDRTIFTGPILDRNELNGIYLASDLFLFPSLYDTYSLVVREAAAFHVPSVVVADSNTAEGMTDGVNGYLCENNTDSFLKAMRRAMSDPIARRNVGITASQTIYRSWDSITDEVIELYQKAIEKKQKELADRKKK